MENDRINRMAELVAQRAKRKMGIPRELRIAEPAPADASLSVPLASCAALLVAAELMLQNPESPDAWLQLQRAVKRMGGNC